MKNDRHEIFKNIGLILQLGLTVIVPVVLLTWLGVFLDKKYGLQLTVLFVLLGIAGGATGAWKLAHASFEKKQEEDEHYDLMKGYGLRSDQEELKKDTEEAPKATKEIHKETKAARKETEKARIEAADVCKETESTEEEDLDQLL